MIIILIILLILIMITNSTTITNNSNKSKPGACQANGQALRRALNITKYSILSSNII